MTKPAKVLWISCVAEKGGAEVYMLNLLRRLDPAKIEPAIAFLRPGPLVEEVRRMGIETFVLRQHRMRDGLAVLRSIMELRRIVAEGRFALVHSNGFRAHVYGGVAARLSGVPAVWLVHTAERSGLSTSAILTIPAAHVVANCQRTADYFVGHGFLTSLVWPSIDPELLARRSVRADLAQRFGIPEEARWIVMGARLQRYKGQEYFIRALASLEGAGDARGIIMGGTLFGMEENFRTELEALAERLGVAERLTFTGFISDEDLRGFVAECEVLIHPALDEDFGLIVAEAQALARPVLAFDSVGPRAIVDDGRTGRLAPVGDQERLNTILREMLADRAGLTRMGAAGQERSRRLFDARAAARQTERIYQACLDDAGR